MALGLILEIQRWSIQSICWPTSRIAFPMRLAIKQNSISPTFIHWAVRHMYIITCPIGTNVSCVSKKAFLLDILTLKNPIRYIFLLNSVCWTLFNIQFNTITMMSCQFQADREEQFLYSSLKSIFWPTEIKLKFQFLKLQEPFQMNLHHLQGQQPLKLYSLPLCLIHC